MITRRRFIGIACLFPLALTLDEKDRRCFTEEIRERLVGTFVHIKAIGAGAGLLYSAVQYMRGFERFFSRFDSESDLSFLNREGVLRKPGRAFAELMEAAAKGYEETEGAFDPTVLPVLSHLERYRKALTASEKERYRTLIGFSKVGVHRDRIYVADRRMKLTLDGIATGYILDKGIEFLKSKGCLEVLINAGGDIYCGKKTEGWKAGIYDPLKDNLSRTLTLETMSVCTSGSYVNYYTKDRTVHHLVDPRTLGSPGELVSATAVARTALRADMLSTALFVAGKEGGSFLRPGEKAYLTTRDGKEVALHGA